MSDTKLKPVKASTVARVEPVKGTHIGPQGPQGPPVPRPVDAELLKALEAKFDAANTASNCDFTVKLTQDQTDYLLNGVIKTIGWKGLEAYAVSKVADDFEGQVVLAKAKDASEDGTLSIDVKYDLLEAVFHFLRSHASTGYDEAKKFTAVAEVFVTPVNELTALRKKAQECAVELEAAKHGMSPDEFVKAYQESQGKN